MKQIIHKTKTYERLDSLAYKYYGNAFEIQRIVAANPALPISPFLPANTEIIIPIPEEGTISKEGLPPWKQ